MAHQPLAEVFGFPFDNLSDDALRYRKLRLCPFNNRVPNCTKDKVNDPLGVCSIYDSEGNMAITCPVRFRQDWGIAEHAAGFFFPGGHRWTTLSEVGVDDANGVSAGKIDLVLVSYDDRGKLLDYGALEVQAVYISGNVRRVFEQYMADPAAYVQEQPAPQRPPRPDYLSSSRKRLVPQLLYKGRLLNAWGRKQAVAVHRGFFETLPALEPVPEADAEIAWFVYDLLPDASVFRLSLADVVYTAFLPALNQITTPIAGPEDSFRDMLQDKLDQKLDDHPPSISDLQDYL